MREAKAAVNHADISRVEIGQTVQIRIDSCPYPDYGVAKGKVSAIAPYAEQQNSDSLGEFNPSNNTPTVYDVAIQAQQATLKTSSQICTLQPGMKGRADIITQQETLLTFILRKMRLLVNI